MRKNKSHLVITFILFCIMFVFDLSALPIFVPQYTYEYKAKIVPLSNFNRSYIIVQINNHEKDANLTVYSSGLRQSDSKFQTLDWNSLSTFALGVIPYKSIEESKYYKKEDELLGQSQIRENCRNYIPTSIGKKNYLLFFRDVRKDFDLEYFPEYEIWDDFDIPAKKSLYIEIDIVNREHKAILINTPENIFADMCK